MRFLLFAAQYLPTSGGVERYTHGLARQLVFLGHEVVVVTSALPRLAAEERQEGIEVVRLPARLLMGGRFPVARKNAAFRAMAARLFEKRCDFAVINTRFYTLSLWAAAECRRRGVPALVLEHGTKHLSLDNALLNVFGNLYEHLAMRLIRRSCDSFYGVSLACCEWLRHFGVEAKGVLYNSVDSAWLAGIVKSLPRDFRRDFGVAETDPLIVFVGRFIAEKGVRELLAAFARLRGKHAGARLIMAGDGPLFPEVQRRAEDGVICTGNLPYNETISLMAQSDVFCLPTYSEGFSSTILEAAAVGACIVTTPTGGSPELIEHNVSGLLLRDTDPGTIAEALAFCLDHPPFRRQAGLAAKKTVEARFTWQITAAKLIRIAGEHSQ